jgi:hypothetical protein
VLRAHRQAHDAFQLSGAAAVRGVRGGLKGPHWATFRRNSPKGTNAFKRDMVAGRYDRCYSNHKGVRVMHVGEGGFKVVGQGALRWLRDDFWRRGYETASDHFGVVVTYRVDRAEQRLVAAPAVVPAPRPVVLAPRLGAPPANSAAEAAELRQALFLSKMDSAGASASAPFDLTMDD